MLSSATCCSRVLQLRAARRGSAGAKPCCIPSCTSPLPRGPVPLAFGFPPGARCRGPGAWGHRAAAELGGGGNPRQGAAPPASPLGKSSSSLLLAKANTALFFPDRANAPGTRAATQRVPVQCSVSSGKAPGVQSLPWPNSQDSSAHRGRPEAHRVPAWPQRPRTLPPPPPRCRKDRQPGNPVSPLAAESAVGIGGLPAPSSFPQRQRQQPPPAGPGPGNFPCLEPGQGDLQPGGGAAVRLEGALGARSSGDRRERLSAGRADAIRQV